MNLRGTTWSIGKLPIQAQNPSTATNRDIANSVFYQASQHIHSLVFNLEGRAWQEPEPSHVTGMALAHCILGKFGGSLPLLSPLGPQRRERS